MFKKLTAIILSLTFGLSVGVSMPLTVAFAQAQETPAGTATPTGGSQNARDPNTLRVYYSESIGAGEQVYHLTWCEKAPAYGPVICSQQLVDADTKFANVCNEVGAKKPKVIEGVPAKGCLQGGGGGGEDEPPATKMKYKISDKEYDLPYYKIDPPENTKCLDDPNNQEFIYGRKYAVLEYDLIDLNDAENNPQNIIGNFSWPTINGADPQLNSPTLNGYLNSTFGKVDNETERIIKPAYEIVQCSSVDLLLDSSGKLDGNTKPQGPDAAVTRYTSYKPQFDTMIKDGCNNDNTSLSVPADQRSTSLNDKPVLTCTLSERINGVSGTDLLARYVGALYRWAAGVIGIISVLVIVVSGVQTTVDSGGLEKAKERIMQSLMGLVLLFLSALILYTINPTFFTG